MVSHVGSVTLPNPCAIVQLTLVFASSCEEPVHVQLVEILYGEHHINPGWWQSETRGPGGLSNAAQAGKSCKVVGCHCTAVQDQGHTSQGTSNAGNGKIKNWLVKEKDYEPGLGSGTPRTGYLPSLTDRCYFLSSFQMLTVQQEGVPRRRPDSPSPALAAKSLTYSLKYGHIAY